MNFSGGPGNTANAAVSGAPGEAQTCGSSSCHNGNAFNQTTTITLSDSDGNLISEYAPNTEYDVTLNIEAGSGTPGGYGFQMVALQDNDDNTSVDGWGELPGGVGSVSLMDRTYIEHTSPSTENTFTLKWTAPDAGTGPINFYATGNAVNRTGSNMGDDAMSTILSVSEALTSPTNDLSLDKSTLSIYPNPTHDVITISMEDREFSGIVKLSNTLGKEILSSDIDNGNKVLNIDDLYQGIYLLSIYDIDNKRMVTKKVIKK